MAVTERKYDRTGKPSQEVLGLLRDKESVKYCFSDGQSMIVFTDRRMIFDDKEGMLSNKHEYTSVPYRTFQKWYTANSTAMTERYSKLVIMTLLDEYQISIEKSLNLIQLHQLISAAL